MVRERRKPVIWERRLTVTVGIMALVSMVFSLGMNWSRIVYLENQLLKQDQRIADLQQKTESRTAELQQRQQNAATEITTLSGDVKVIRTQTDDIKASLARLEGAIYRR